MPYKLQGKGILIMGLSQEGLSNVEVAKIFGVTEGAIRYRLKRIREGKVDGRKKRSSQLDTYREMITSWIEDQRSFNRRKPITALERVLRIHHNYQGSYDALRRYVRKHYPEFMGKRVRIRIETPPGALVQVDWKENLRVQIGGIDRWVRLNGFIFTLGFSRKTVIIISEKKDLSSWIHCHQEAFRKLGGLPKYLRPDCLRSAIQRWKGEDSIVNKRYAKYLSSLGVLVFPSRPGMPTDKGKVEKKIGDFFGGIDLSHYVFKDLTDLQEWVDRELEEREEVWRCGATGISVAESYAYEREKLRGLPEIFPLFPLEERRCKVRRDMTVYFKGNYYQLSSHLVGRKVLCTYTGRDILIYHQGREIARFPYLPEAKGMVRLSEDVLQDSGVYLSDTVRRWAIDVARRQVSIYEELIQRRER